MKHQLINNDLTRVTRPIKGWLPQREVAEGQEITAPPGHRYVPILDRPEAGTGYDPATQRIERHTTLEADGWRVIDLTPEEIRARSVPGSVTRRQLFLVLASLDPPITRDGIRAMLAGNELGLIEFEEAISFERNHPLIGQLAAALGLDDAAVDSLFTQAATF